MPAILANARNFLLTTDFPLDKVIYMHVGSFVVGAATSTSTTVAHGLPFTPLLEGTWSTVSDFSSLSYDMGSGPAATTMGFVFDVQVTVSADATNAIITCDNVTGSPVTVYYRVFGYEPSNSNLEVPHTATTESFILNTDFNYTKLYLHDVVTASTTVSHTLGYRPQVSIWEELAGVIRKKNESDVNNTFGVTLVKVSTSTLTITYVSAPVGTKVHYRLYLDE